ncbi:MAG: TonB-dependent receptor, partial [Bacteroidetes bacterium]|nr:TonB-dependent receptor [Bacteroidota bacterium]
MRLLKQCIAFLVMLTLCYSSEAQNASASIKGKISTLDGKSAEGVSVIIKGTTKAVLSDEAGVFIFRRLEVGEYDLEVSLVGYKTQLQHVTVTAGQTTAVNMTLVISAADLHEVVITTGRGSLSKKESNTIARMPLKNLENPQTYSLVSKEIMKEQITVDGREAVRNATGAAPVTYPAGGFGIISRGFSTGINARNGMETIASRSSVDIGNVERIEVIKGPSGTLFGSSIASFGGVVNLVTKKPFETLKGELSYTAGSYGLNRLTADINAPMNQDKTALFRINTVVNRQNSFLNYGYNNTVLVAPSFLYKVNDRFTLLADAEYYLVNQTRVTYTRVNPTVRFSNPADIPLAYDKSLYLDDANAKTSSSKFFLEGKYQLSPGWISSTLFS